MFKRIFCIVIDSVGCGTAPLSHEYGDHGANTLSHIAEAMNGINIPTLEKLGIGYLTNIKGVSKANEFGYYGKMDELSSGKDTMTGHWEIMGIHTTSPFKTFTDTGFPNELIDELEPNRNRIIREWIRGESDFFMHRIFEEMNDFIIKSDFWELWRKEKYGL